MQTRPTPNPKLLPVALQISQRDAQSSRPGPAQPTQSPVDKPQTRPKRPSKWYLFWTWPVDAVMTVGDAIWRPPHQHEIEEVRATLDPYLQSRIVRKDIAEPPIRTDKQVPVKIDLAAELATLLEIDCGPQPIVGIRPEDFERAFWNTFLAQDHGLANLYGHAVPNSQYYYGLYGKLPLRQFGSVTEAIQSIEEKGMRGQGSRPYTFIPIKHARFVSRRIGFSGRLHMVAFNFKYLPHDTVFIVLTKRQGAWAISELLWIAG
jgi:hypothetical protein